MEDNMADIKPFVCVRPAEDVVSAVAALPYDVYNREEAKEVVAKNPKSFLAIDRAETQFPDDVDTYDDRVYAKAAQMLKDWIADGTFIQDNRECYYIYELTMDGMPAKRRRVRALRLHAPGSSVSVLRRPGRMPAMRRPMSSTSAPATVKTMLLMFGV